MLAAASVSQAVSNLVPEALPRMSGGQQRKTLAGRRGGLYGKEQDVKCCACILEAWKLL